MARPRVALIIPTLNEEEAIGGVLAAVPRDVVDQVIVADSGSTDRTVERARAGGARVVSETRRGYGRACRAGAEAAGDCDILVFLDGDGSDRPELIPALLAPILEGGYDFVIGSRTRGRRERGSMSAHQIIAGYAVGFALRLLYGVALHRHVPVSRDPSRSIGAARHARDDIWLEPGNADAGGSRRPAHPRDPGRPPPAGRWRLKGFRQPVGNDQGEPADRRDPDPDCLRRTAVMRPNPISDVSKFLTQPGWPTPVFWLLIIASIAIAVYAWRTIPAQRTGTNLFGWAARFFIGALWWQQSLWKLPPYYTDHPGSPFGTTGLAYWMGLMGKYAAIPLQSDFVNNIVLPHFYLFAPIVYAAEVLTGSILDPRTVRPVVGRDRRIADPQSVARPVLGPRRMAVDLFLFARAAIDLCRAPLWPRPRPRRDHRQPHRIIAIGRCARACSRW